MVRPEKLFKVLQKLKEMEHPYYQCYDTEEEYSARREQREEIRNRQMRKDQDWDDVEEKLSPIPDKESKTGSIDKTAKVWNANQSYTRDLQRAFMPFSFSMSAFCLLDRLNSWY